MMGCGRLALRRRTRHGALPSIFTLHPLFYVRAARRQRGAGIEPLHIRSMTDPLEPPSAVPAAGRLPRGQGAARAAAGRQHIDPVDIPTCCRTSCCSTCCARGTAAFPHPPRPARGRGFPTAAASPGATPTRPFPARARHRSSRATQRDRALTAAPASDAARSSPPVASTSLRAHDVPLARAASPSTC
jgi:hypothetical protein